MALKEEGRVDAAPRPLSLGHFLDYAVVENVDYSPIDPRDAFGKARYSNVFCVLEALLSWQSPCTKAGQAKVNKQEERPNVEQ